MPVTFTNKEEIANRALLKLGAGTLVSFDDETPQADVVKSIYKSFVQSQLTKGNWHFATKKQQFTRLDETPINEWQYVFQIPADLLKLRALYNSDQTGILSIDNFEIFQNRILYSNQLVLYGDYITYTDESYWPYYFVDFIVAALAAEIAFPITRSQSTQQLHHQIAYGSPEQNDSGGLFGEAARQDSAMNPAEPLRLDYLISPRFSF